MDLISRKAAIDAIRAWAERPVIRKSRGFEPKGKAIVLDMIGVVTEQPSVPAVPLDKLCELLGGAVTPCSLLNIGCPYNEATRKDCDSCIAREAWKITLSKWMEEQDADRK